MHGSRPLIRLIASRAVWCFTCEHLRPWRYDVANTGSRRVEVKEIPNQGRKTFPTPVESCLRGRFAAQSAGLIGAMHQSFRGSRYSVRVHSGPSVFFLNAMLPNDPWARHARPESRPFHKNDSDSGSVDRISVLICEDHSIYREGVKSILSREPDLKVVGEASDGTEAANLVTLLRPDVMLLNLSLPGMRGLDAARHIQTKDGNVRILVFGMYDDEDTALRCREAGVSGYLLKDASAPQLLLAVRHVRNSEQFLTPASLKKLDYLPLNSNVSKEEELAWNVLSPRQREILLFLAEGFSYKEIGARLNLSVKTVDTHKYNLMRKLNIQSRAGLIRFAIRQRLIEA